MSQSISYKTIEVQGESILTFVNCMPRGKDLRLSILAKHNIVQPEIGKWYNMQSYLDAFKEVSETLGDMNLLLMGIAIMETAEFPPTMGMEEFFRMLDIAYHLAHRLDDQLMFNPNTGQFTEGIGHCELLEFDDIARKAVMKISTPYPSKYTEGSLLGTIRKFKPQDISTITVKIDITKEQRSKGGDSCTFLMSW